MCISTISKTPHGSLNRKECVENISKENGIITKVEHNLSTTSAGTFRGMKGCSSERKRLNIQDHDNNP